MPKHEDMDFKHSAAYCDDCYLEARDNQVLLEMRRANDLKERELELREMGSDAWVEPTPRFRRTYVLPPPQPNIKGGTFVEPRRNHN